MFEKKLIKYYIIILDVIQKHIDEYKKQCFIICYLINDFSEKAMTLDVRMNNNYSVQRIYIEGLVKMKIDFDKNNSKTVGANEQNEDRQIEKFSFL